MATVRLPAEAEGFKVQTVAEGMRSVSFPEALLLTTNIYLCDLEVS